jgi:hypothetical protein
MRTFPILLLVFSGALLAARTARADLAACEQGIQDFAKYKKTWGARVDQASSDPAACQATDREAQSQVPIVPKDCDSVTIGEVPADFQELLLSLLPDASAISPNALVGGVLKKASYFANDQLDQKCFKAASATAGRGNYGDGSRLGTPVISVPSNSGTSGNGAAGSGRAGGAL